jgi:hypothetical protein
MENVELIKRLADHVQRQRDNREKDRDYEPTDVEVAERRQLMDDIVDALELPPKEIQTKLDVNRTTWERWRTMESTPNSSHLDHLKRLLRDHDKPQAMDVGARSVPIPLAFLSATPRTSLRLSNLFTRAAYKWQDAVFHFTSPFDDDSTIGDMASLAGNGCRIVYIVSHQLDEKKLDRWPGAFVKRMMAGFGAKQTAETLASFCIVTVPETQFAAVGEFGVLNFTSGKEESRVGYHWRGDKKATKRPDSSMVNVYDAVAANDDSFSALKRQYNAVLCDAFELIDENVRKGVHEPEYDDQNRRYQKLPVIDSETKAKHELKFYV